MVMIVLLTQITIMCLMNGREQQASSSNFAIPQLDGYEVGGNAGIEYEEKICEAAEKACDFMLHDNKDRSFNRFNKYQGKQWNK